MPNEHEGHRQRMIQKLNKKALADHELLEVLLFFVLKRKDTNGIAHALLAEFGSLKNVFFATVEQLQLVDGIGKEAATMISCIGQIFESINHSNKSRFPKKFENESFLSFVNREYADLEKEVLDAYLIRNDQTILLHHRFTSQSTSSVQVEMQDLAFLLGVNKPAGLVLVHNHPSGRAEPSKKDDETTFHCRQLCRMHNVILCDHFIYSPVAVFSYYRTGRLQSLDQIIDVNQLLKNELARRI
ncbi:MAG: hypothetical protein IJ506_06210 [Clostridia bacterium]|nr:hypothetical protein [Clostridia bacterium]